MRISSDAEDFARTANWDRKQGNDSASNRHSAKGSRIERRKLSTRSPSV